VRSTHQLPVGSLQVQVKGLLVSISARRRTPPPHGERLALGMLAVYVGPAGSMGTEEPPVVTAHTPDHGPHALRLGHAALLQRAHRGGAKRHAAGHVATSTSRTGPRALFRRPDKVGTMGCQEFFEPYGFSFNSCARRVDDEKLIPQIGGEMADLKLPLFPPWKHGVRQLLQCGAGGEGQGPAGSPRLRQPTDPFAPS
jgi:hypothetical protein